MSAGIIKAPPAQEGIAPCKAPPPQWNATGTMVIRMCAPPPEPRSSLSQEPRQADQGKERPPRPPGPPPTGTGPTATFEGLGDPPNKGPPNMPPPLPATKSAPMTAPQLLEGSSVPLVKAPPGQGMPPHQAPARPGVPAPKEPAPNYVPPTRKDWLDDYQ